MLVAARKKGQHEKAILQTLSEVNMSLAEALH